MKKKKSNKPLFILLSFLLIFGIFIYGVTRPSQQSIAIKEIEVSVNKDDIKNIFYKYKTELTGTNDKGEAVIDEEFLYAIRKKLHSFNLSNKETKECLTWLPASSTSLNLIVVPDLSKRIIDEVNNPDQIKSDVDLLKHIWATFENNTKLKINSKDRLIIDVTDEAQANGQFRTLANNLIFDLSEHKGQSNRLYFDKIGGQFEENINQLYGLAKKQPIGADYWYYFNRSLSKHIQRTTLFDNYRNVLIILTDGYLEAQNKTKTGIAFYTGNYPSRFQTYNNIKRGLPIEQALNGNIDRISDCSQHFPELEVLVLEIKERKPGSKEEPSDPGTPRDYDILEYLWKDWFKTLEIKNTNDNFFIARNDATQLTKKAITKFLMK